MLELVGVTHIYGENSVIECKALDNVTLEIPLGKFVVVLGQSGSGKTTLLHVMAGLLKPTKGKVTYDGEDIYQMNDKKLSLFRRDHIGFVFQNYFLDPSFRAIDNVRVPLFLHKKMTLYNQVERAKEVLNQVGLLHKAYNKPTQLSGGECQRVAIARALVNEPRYIFADEPTGNLDSKSGDRIVDLLRQQVSPTRTVIMVTHNSRYIQASDVVYQICDGQVEQVK